MKQYLLSWLRWEPKRPDTMNDAEQKARELEQRLRRLSREVEVYTHDTNPEEQTWMQ